jgi:bifunctional lysine-specific demethylase and histidyl-hydroxylase MINA
MGMTFDDLMAPLGAETFRRDYLGQRPVHIEGGADKFVSLMNWSILERLLAVNTLWDTTRLDLVLDKELVAKAAYAGSQPAITGLPIADPLKVKRYVQQGATMVLNDIDQLTPELTAFAKTMEDALGGKVQGNLYQSSRRRQGFKVHYDTHDVFAVHCEGEKVWPVFEGRAEDPIAHNMFKGVPQEAHEEAKGKLWKEVRLKPGDLLYLPRGQYHYALADDGGCIHIAMGVTYPIGIDLVGYLYERLIADPLCRRNLPQGDGAALDGHLAALGERISSIMTEPATRRDIEAFIKGYRYVREPYDMAKLLEPAAVTYAVKANGVKLIEQQGRHGLVKEGSRQAVAVPKEVAAMVAWVLKREAFERGELDQAFAAADKPALDRFIQDMERMALIAARA